MKKKMAVVTTTIRMPTMLEECCKNAKFYGHKDVEMFVIGDKKTPPQVRGYCSQLSNNYGYQIHYLGDIEQEKSLEKYPCLLDMIPYNDACRKIYGMVIAYIKGFDVMIAIDDDNFPTNHDYFGCHSIVGDVIEMPLVESPSGWFNTCQYLIEEKNIPFYYRGIPWSKRKAEKDLITIHKGKAKIVVNSGFWLEDPDIDATSRLFWPIRVTGMKTEMEPNFGLYPGTWCPFNNQNTAMAREILPAYFTPPKALRFSDLWPAFVVNKIAGHLNSVISYGYPFVRQIRNPHNYWQDIKDEIVGAQATEPLIEMLRSAKLTGKNYHDCLGELNSYFSSQIGMLEKYPMDQRNMLVDFMDNLKLWHRVFESIHESGKNI